MRVYKDKVDAWYKWMAAAKSHFDDGNVHLLLSEIIERHGGGQLKERRVKRFEEAAVSLHEIHHILFGNPVSVDAYPLPEVDQMR